jgi:hypothetical protein
MTRARGFPALQRRVLPLADCKVVHLTAGDGVIEVQGYGRFHYRPLCAEHYDELLRYMPEAVARTREWLLEGSQEWAESGGRIVPVYSVGWPDGPKVAAVGAKAAAEALRRYYPARDYQGDGATDDATEAQPDPGKAKVVPLTGPAVIRSIFDQRRWDDRG